MRLLFFFLFSTTSSVVCAQVTEAEINRKLKESIQKRVEEDNARRMGPSFPLIKIDVLPRTQDSILPRKPGVYGLPLDGMPCIVPDTTGIAAIPNASPFMMPFRKDIPNAVPKKRVPIIK